MLIKFPVPVLIDLDGQWCELLGIDPQLGVLAKRDEQPVVVDRFKERNLIYLTT